MMSTIMSWTVALLVCVLLAMMEVDLVISQDNQVLCERIDATSHHDSESAKDSSSDSEDITDCYNGF